MRLVLGAETNGLQLSQASVGKEEIISLIVTLDIMRVVPLVLTELEVIVAKQVVYALSLNYDFFHATQNR